MITLTKPVSFSKSVVNLHFTKDCMVFELQDGRTLSVPLLYFPRLLHATPSERSHWKLIGNGVGIHFEDIDEDISIDALFHL